MSRVALGKEGIATRLPSGKWDGHLSRVWVNKLRESAILIEVRDGVGYYLAVRVSWTLPTGWSRHEDGQ
ncbi:MAG: hypothetical protein KAX78_12735 [Phycisphaerae bacterium]|nr:hypothetical protein [Phycisphaerae bacterium]